MRQQRIFVIIILCLIVKQLESKAWNSGMNFPKENHRVKRGGYGGHGGHGSYGGHDDYDSTIHVSSGVIQYADAHASSGIEDGGHYEAPSEHDDPWASSGLSPGYEVWLEPSTSYHSSSSSPDHHTSITASHPGSDFIANSVFSEHSDQSDHHSVPVSQLHTEIISSSGISSSSHGIHDDHDDHSISTVSDNIDFNNVSDVESKHYAKSYGK